MRDGVKWSDGQPLTAADVAFTYNRVLTGGIEANNWSSYLNEVTSVTAPDAQTVVLTLSKPNAVLPLLPIPILPEHVWKNVSEKEMKSYAAEPKTGQPVVGSGPFRLVEGTAGGSTFRFVKNPHYWNGTPARRRGRLPDVQEQRPRGAGADQGRGRLRLRRHAAAGQGAPGHEGDHRPRRRLAAVRGDRLQHRCGRHQDEQADGRRQQGAEGPEVPARPRLRRRHLAARPERLPGCGEAGLDGDPGRLHQLPLDAARRPRRSRSTSRRRRPRSTRPATS